METGKSADGSKYYDSFPSITFDCDLSKYAEKSDTTLDKVFFYWSTSGNHEDTASDIIKWWSAATVKKIEASNELKASFLLSRKPYQNEEQKEVDGKIYTLSYAPFSNYLERYDAWKLHIALIDRNNDILICNTYIDISNYLPKSGNSKAPTFPKVRLQGSSSLLYKPDKGGASYGWCLICDNMHYNDWYENYKYIMSEAEYNTMHKFEKVRKQIIRFDVSGYIKKYSSNKLSSFTFEWRRIESNRDYIIETNPIINLENQTISFEFICIDELLEAVERVIDTKVYLSKYIPFENGTIDFVLKDGITQYLYKDNKVIETITPSVLLCGTEKILSGGDSYYY